MTTKRVCIVGSGPSGLVAAKLLLHDAPPGAFQVDILDTQPRIGGLWPATKEDTEGLMHPLMIANQSKHTVQFSDLAWEPSSPEMPRAWQVGGYLERYWRRYCQGAQLRLKTTVVSANPIPSVTGGQPGAKWRVRSQGSQGEERTEDFDYLLVASGYFGKPVVDPELSREAQVPVIHSSRYRDLGGLLGENTGSGGTILVVGGQMSGVEIAGTIATHISSAVNTPSPEPIAQAEQYSVHHISDRPVWVFPLHTSPKPTSSRPPFLPVDLPLYDLKSREAPVSIDTQGHIPVEYARKANAFFTTALGGDQSLFSSLLAVNGQAMDSAPYLAVSDNYLDFVRSGDITLSTGRLESVSGNVAVIKHSGERVQNLAAVVLATGFDASSSLSFLPERVRETLSVAPDDLGDTVALGFHGTYHPDVPNLGFVGFYRSPYWGVMEMQARFLTSLWAAGGPGAPALSPAMRAAIQSDTSIERTKSLRGDPRRAQFPMGDYAYLMQQFATALGLQRSDPLGSMNILTPARYASANLSRLQADEVAASLQQTHETAMAGLTKGRFVAKAVFRSLLGQWVIQRDVVNKLSSHPRQCYQGVATFLPREGMEEGGEEDDDFHVELEYLHVENGMPQVPASQSFRPTVWRYNDSSDKLSVWSGRAEDPRKVDRRIYDIDFIVSSEGDGGDGRWEAKAENLCEDGVHDVKYEFTFQAVNLKQWRIVYTVKEAGGEYVIESVYRRQV